MYEKSVQRELKDSKFHTSTLRQNQVAHVTLPIANASKARPGARRKSPVLPVTDYVHKLLMFE